MKTLKTIVDGKTDQSTPQWIEVKVSHLMHPYFRLVTLGDCFQEKVFLVKHWTQKTNRFWVHCKKWICFLVDHWTQKTNRF